VGDPDGDAGIGQRLAPVAQGPPGGLVLHDLHVVPVGIDDPELQVADLALADRRRHRQAKRRQVVAHPGRIVGVKRDVVHAAVVARRFVEQLDVLLVVHLDEGDAIPPIGVREGERLAEAQEILVERPGLGQVADEQGHVGDAQNARCLRGALGWRWRRRGTGPLAGGASPET
jgi:hypothetical protein